MINYLHYLLHKPQNGWDPVSIEYAEKYAEQSFNNISLDLIEEVVDFTKGLMHKQILDLGAGPSQYSIAFKKLGAYVTWFDISKNYQNIARQRAKVEELEIDHFVLDYMDNVHGHYDVIFNRVCWYYCMNDKSFANNIFNSLKDNGKLFITLHNEDFKSSPDQVSLLKKFMNKVCQSLNNTTGFKIGHPHMSKVSIEYLFKNLKTSYCEISHDSMGTSTIKIIK